MLHKKINYLIGKEISHSQNLIFNDLAINFFSDLSSELKRNKSVLKSPDLFFLMMWCTKKNLIINKERYRISSLRIGRGIIFHICPSNVPLNFFYSFAYGLLSGNSNIVKLPSRNYLETNILISAIKKTISKKKYLQIKKNNIFIKYEKDKLVNDFFSTKSDIRIIWGGDNTINEVRESKLNSKSFELTFPDRYSLSIINIESLKKTNTNEFKKLVKAFFYDSFTMKQQACNSPHFIFWTGKKDNKIIEKFWISLSKVAKQFSNFSSIDMIDKLNHMCNQFLKIDNLQNYKNYNNFVYVVEYKEKEIENIRGLNGIFYQKYINNIQDLSPYINHKCQTVTYFGFDKKTLENFIINNKNPGIDRIVPIGKSMNTNFIWDGFDMIKSLSRIVDIQ
jgi:hypothetical protein